jgi:hypothetical protein
MGGVLVATVLLFVGMAAGISVIASWTSLPASTPLVNAASLTIPKSRLNLGRVWSQPDYRWSLPLENRGERPIVIHKFIADCTCTAVRPASLVIAPHSTENIELALNLTPGDNKRLTRQWAFSVKITAVVSEPKEPGTSRTPNPTWLVKGQVENIFRMPKSTVHLGRNTWNRGHRLEPATIRVESFEPLMDLSLKCDPPIARTAVRPVSSKRNLYEIIVSPTELMRAGAHEIKLGLLATTRDGQKLPQSQIRALCHVANDVVVSTPTLVFGNLEVGSPGIGTIDLRSQRQIPFEVIDISKSRTVEVVRTFPHVGRYTIRCTPSAPGTSAATVVFTIRQAGEQYDIPVSIAFLAVEPQT